MVARLAGGAIWDVVERHDGLSTQVRFERCPAGWQATFELRHDAVDDLAVVHRLVAPSLAEAKLAVPKAIAFMLGAPIDSDFADDGFRAF